MEPPSISEYCIYAIVKGKKLEGLSDAGCSKQFTEGKRWVTAAALWKKSLSMNRAMPVLFGDAADCSRLLFWGLITDVQVQDGATLYTVDRVRRLEGKHTPQELRLRRTGKQIANNFIRSYAICHTPHFLGVKDKA